MKIFTYAFVLIGLFSGISWADDSNPIANKGNQGAAYIKAQIYLYHWNVISNRIRSIPETRDSHSEYLEMTDPNLISSFVSWLKLAQMKPEQHVGQRDANFVIDLTKQDGSVKSFYSNGCYLYSSDSKYSKPIDRDFRKQFDFYGNDMTFESNNKKYDVCSELNN